MNVLSLFDGMSCGQQALERIGCKVDNYFASEIDKYAIQVTMANYPNTIQLGSVVDLDCSKLPKIDLLIGGSPCQSFSFAGKRKGMSTKDNIEILTLEYYLQLKQEGYEFEGQSYLFWEYMRILNEVKPKYFLLENVMMGEHWEKVLSRAIGVNPIEINSALLSAQNRRRLYWTNIGMKPAGLFGDLESYIVQPKDKGILLKDILEKEVDEKYYLGQKTLDYFKLNSVKQKERKNGFSFNPLIGENKSKCVTTKEGTRMEDNYIIVHNMQKRSPDRPSVAKNKNAGGSGHLQREDGKIYCLDTGNNMSIEYAAIKYGRTEEAKQIRKENMRKGVDTTPFQAKEITGLDYEKMNTLTRVISKDNLIMQLNLSKESHNQQPYHQNRIYDANGITSALCANKSDLIIKNKSNIRRLTPIECERLQTVKDNYTSMVSDTQRYRMLGNGWTVDVIAHILKYME